MVFTCNIWNIYDVPGTVLGVVIQQQIRSCPPQGAAGLWGNRHVHEISLWHTMIGLLHMCMQRAVEIPKGSMNSFPQGWVWA